MRKFAALVALAATASLAAAGDASQHRRVGDIDIYYGMVPSEIVGARPMSDEEKAMHGGMPAGRDRYHLVVALYGVDGKRIADARVGARVGELGMAGRQRELQPMQVGDGPSFGNYFVLKGKGPYRIAIEVRLPGRDQPVGAVFDYRRQ